ncbi:hypothetical protein WA026_001836 [Henosepilachna vigintioctopunctata]|uniref:UDP-glucuronosyltransferase n=1 Tax=Henosepilachna vigintioctopunctata TaxID=420089 RepID=A0AAW1UUK0_9CUCU
MLRVVSFLIVVIFFINTIKCAEILAIFHSPPKSMHLGGVALAEILAENKHNVTFVSSVEISPPPRTFTHVFLDDVAEASGGHMNYFNMNTNSYHQAYLLEHIGIGVSNATIRNPKFKQLLSSKKFDLVILEAIYSDSLIFIAEYLNVPLLLYSSVDAFYFSNFIFGNYAPASFIPNLLTGYTSDMTFFQRVDNLLISIACYLMHYTVGIPTHDIIVKDNFRNAPHIAEYNNKASVMLLNSDSSVTQPVPLVPGMIDIGGFHIKKPKKLPRDLEELLNNSKHGVIYFSLGSLLQSSEMSNQTIKTLIEVFSKLKETVLWKWEDEELPEKPPNVIIKKWLPQNDILAHKNVKLFITHGGLHSLLETVYHAVPCVMIPVFFDQKRNAKRAQSCGFAENINFEELTSEKLELAVRKVLNNPKYTESVKKRSSIMRDKPLSPAETLLFWVNYVIRHNGAHHLKVSSLKLAWYQYFLLDVSVFLAACLIFSILLIRYLFQSMMGKRTTKKIKTK